MMMYGLDENHRRIREPRLQLTSAIPSPRSKATTCIDDSGSELGWSDGGSSRPRSTPYCLGPQPGDDDYLEQRPRSRRRRPSPGLR